LAQIFPKQFNLFSRLSIVVGVLVLGGGLGLVVALYHSPYFQRVDTVQMQPVPFSHEHHVRGLGIDCRYCHTSVEKSSFAGMPSTKTCITCHSQIWTNAAILEPVREAWRTGMPIPWVRVYNLPDYVYFNHSIHLAKGIGCVNCHGSVDKMPGIYQAHYMTMSWCLTCHRHPGKYIQPKETVFQMDWNSAENDPHGQWGPELLKKYNVKNRTQMQDCYTCHR
jgi:hypothetical protein